MTILSYRLSFVFVASGLALTACQPIGTTYRQHGHPHRGTAYYRAEQSDNSERSASDAPVHGNSSAAGASRAPSRERSFESPTQTQAEPESFSSTPLPPEVKERLNLSGFTRHLGNLYSRSRDVCAKYVRMGLETLFGTQIGGQGHAKDYTAETLNRFAKKQGLKYSAIAESTTPPYQDFDVRVSQNKPGGSKYGHIEIFYQGRWYSDFAQSNSLKNEMPWRYSSSKTYRLGIASNIAKLLESLGISWLVPEAVAQSGLPRTESTEAHALEKKLMASAKDALGNEWKLVEESQGEVPTYVLYKVTAKDAKEVSRLDGAPFTLLQDADASVPALALADDLMRRWEKRDGRDEVQKSLRESTGLGEFQRDTYVRNGFELPKNYDLIVPAK
jgi:hypothetical protein